MDIQTKARSLYDTFTAKQPEDGSGDREEDEDVEDPKSGTSSNSPRKKWQFSASNGWFAKFQKRYGLKSISLHSEAASADTLAAETYVNETFKKIISKGGYEPQQVFNMDETGLFWKRMPSRTFCLKRKRKPVALKHKRTV